MWQHACPLFRKRMRKKLVGVVLEEFNEIFSLQLNLKLLMAYDMREPLDTLKRGLSGGSYSSHILDQVIKENARILEAKMPGFQLTERACSEMAYDLRNISKDIPDNHSTLSWSVRFFTIQSTMGLWRRMRCSCPRRVWTTGIILRGTYAL